MCPPAASARGLVRLYLAVLAASEIFQPSGQARERVAKRDIHVLVVIAVDDELVPGNADGDGH